MAGKCIFLGGYLVDIRKKLYLCRQKFLNLFKDMKKLFYFVAAMLLFAACGSKPAQTEAEEKEDAALELVAETPSTEVGDLFVDVVVPTEDGAVQRLSDYVGNGRKLTVVDFWASWCRPCKEEIPFLKDVYARYHDQGVEVVGVATWDKIEDTQAAILQLGISYPQILNAQSIGSDAYGIEGIPEIILIGEDGTILARGLRQEGIEEAIKEHLNAE